MRYPKFLEKNGTIGFVAPSFGCNTEPYKSTFDAALARFNSMGYKTLPGPNSYAGEGVGISNTPEKCAKELMDMYVSPDNDILISCGGGELMCETMSEVDLDVIKSAEPKWYMGYSDNTNMTFLLTTVCDVASVYGPCAPSFGMDTLHQCHEDAFSILTGEKWQVSGYDAWEKESLKTEENPYMPYNLTEKKILKLFNKGETIQDDAAEFSFDGRLVGGCMDCLVTLLGTRFDKVGEFVEKYKKDGFVWFLESCDLNVFSIRRAIWQMKEAGWFKYTKGFIIGRPLCFGQDMMGLNQYDAVTALLKEFNVPIVMDADIGHLSPMMPLVCGSMAKVSADKNNISISMRWE